jgi:hypothetical protein
MLMEVLLPVLVMLVMLLLQSVLLLLPLLWLSTAITRLFSVGSAPVVYQVARSFRVFLIFLEAYNVRSVLLGLPIFSFARSL